VRFAHFVRDLFQPARGHAPARLGFTRLEDRCNPADYVWWPEVVPPAPEVADFYDLDNWRISVDSPDHPTELPNYDDDLIFIGNASTADCVIPAQNVTSGNAFNSIRLLFGPVAGAGEIGGGSTTVPPAYTGTVTLQDDAIKVGTLIVQCGQIEQYGTAGMTITPPLALFAGTLTVTSQLDWTGGTLNSNEFAAGKIDLAPGASGVAAPSFTNPGIDGKVYLGSTLRLLGDADTHTGSTLELNDGTYNVIRGHFEVEEESTLSVVPTAPDDDELILAPVPSTRGKGVTIKPNGEEVEREEDGSIINQGTAIFTTLGRNRSTKVVPITLKGAGPRVLNVGGNVQITGYVDVALVLTDDIETNTDAYHQMVFIGSVANANELPVTYLEAGSSITSQQNGCVRIDDGNLVITPLLGGYDQPLPRVKQVATISMGVPTGTPALVTSRTVIQSTVIGQPDTVIPCLIRFPDTDDAFSTLDVKGEIAAYGDFQMEISRTEEGEGDRVVSDAKITFGDDTRVSVQWQCSTLAGTPAGENKKWVLFDAASGTQTETINRTPTFDPPVGGTPAITVTLSRNWNNNKVLAES
jgi:hypothetical protein